MTSERIDEDTEKTSTNATSKKRYLLKYGLLAIAGIIVLLYFYFNRNSFHYYQMVYYVSSLKNNADFPNQDSQLKFSFLNSHIMLNPGNYIFCEMELYEVKPDGTRYFLGKYKYSPDFWETYFPFDFRVAKDKMLQEISKLSRKVSGAENLDIDTYFSAFGSDTYIEDGDCRIIYYSPQQLINYAILPPRDNYTIISRSADFKKHMEKVISEGFGSREGIPKLLCLINPVLFFFDTEGIANILKNSELVLTDINRRLLTLESNRMQSVGIFTKELNLCKDKAVRQRRLLERVQSSQNNQFATEVNSNINRYYSMLNEIERMLQRPETAVLRIYFNGKKWDFRGNTVPPVINLGACKPDQSRDNTFLVENRGMAPLQITGIQINEAHNNFSVNPSQFQVLNIADTVSFTITFSPQLLYTNSNMQFFINNNINQIVSIKATARCDDGANIVAQLTRYENHVRELFRTITDPDDFKRLFTLPLDDAISDMVYDLDFKQKNHYGMLFSAIQHFYAGIIDENLRKQVIVELINCEKLVTNSRESDVGTLSWINYYLASAFLYQRTDSEYGYARKHIAYLIKNSQGFILQQKIDELNADFENRKIN